MVASKFCWADASAEEDNETSWQVGSGGKSPRQSSIDNYSSEATVGFSMPELPRDSFRQLSREAPEFIPTLTAACPAICVGTLCVEDEDLDSTAGSRYQRQRCPVLAQRRKVQLACLDVPAQMMRSKDHRQSPQGVMPDASEDEWQHRRETRMRAILVAKNTREYQSHSRSKLDIEFSAVEPMTPDPADRSISARQWKYEVQQWRSAFAKRWEQDAHGSVVSTEDGVSDTLSSAATDEF